MVTSVRVPHPPLLSLYLALARLAGPFAGHVARRRARRGAEDPARIAERLGSPAGARPDGRLVWIHAASVGESLSALDLVRRLTAAGHAVLLTTNTVTSARLLAERLPRGAFHRFLPYDFGPGVARFLDHWRPDVAVWIESEFWPRLLIETQARGIPMLLANARMSDRSFARWRKRPALARALLGLFDAVLVPDASTHARFAQVGVAPDRLREVGALKETLVPLAFDRDERDRLAALWAGRPVWLAASTHAGEEEIAAEAHVAAWPALNGLLMILAPRHPERAAGVASQLRARGLSVVRRTAETAQTAVTDVYLADTLGEMGLWFDLAPVSFVGGSLVDVGGHNPFEPAAQGSAIVHGPHVGNFADAYARLAGVRGATEVQDAAGLSGALLALSVKPVRDAMTAAARGAFAQPTPALDLTFRAVLDAIPGAGPDMKQGATGTGRPV